MVKLLWDIASAQPQLMMQVRELINKVLIVSGRKLSPHTRAQGFSLRTELIARVPAALDRGRVAAQNPKACSLVFVGPSQQGHVTVKPHSTTFFGHPVECLLFLGNAW